MKLSYRLSLLVSVILMSCSQYDDTSVQQDDSDLIFSRIHATLVSTGTKTIIDDDFGDIQWSSGDSISIFTDNPILGGYKFTCEEGGQTAVFNGNIPESKTIIGLYPYNSQSTFSSSVIETVIPDNQNAVENGFDPLSYIAVGKSSTREMGFNNVCGGIRFTVSNNTYDKIIFRTNANESISGPIKITVSDNTKPVAVAASEGAGYVILNNDSTFQTGTHYYISALPQDLTQGFTFEFYQSDKLISKTVCKTPVEIKRSVFSTIVNADVQSSIDKIVDGFDLSAELGTSNCYIVSKAGYFKFPAVQGNLSTTFANGIDSVSLLWETANTVEPIKPNSIISSVKLKSNYVYFSTPELLKDGNALIAAYRSGKIIWNWHIWVCNGYDPDASSQSYGGTYMLDRNIGALSAAHDDLSSGLMYQWGRKDPFMGPATISSKAKKMYSTNSQTSKLRDGMIGTVNAAIQIPTTFICCPSSIDYGQNWIAASVKDDLWNSSQNTKTIYDPCPPGWKVPAGGASTGNPWTGLEYRFVKSTNGIQGMEFLLADGTTAWYPSNGYLKADDFSLVMPGEIAFYWSSTPNSAFVCAMQISSPYSSTLTPSMSATREGKVRSEGHSVRCVKE